jgi:hypothetical protein
MTRSTPTPASTVIRVTLAVVGSVGLLIGVIAVFRSPNQAGAVTVLIGGLLFIAAAIGYPSNGTATWFGGWGRRTGTDAVATLLRSPSPQVRLASAEAVLGPPAPNGRSYTAVELRELALRLADLLRRGGYRVTAADSVDAALTDPAANVVVEVDGADGPVQIPILISNDGDSEVPRVVAELAIAAGRFNTRSAVAVFSGLPHGAVPLGSVTPVGEIRIFTVHSPRLGDEQSVLAAIGQAVEVAAATPAVEAPVRSPISPQHLNGSAPVVSPAPAEEPQHN